MNRESKPSIFEKVIGALDMRAAVAALETVADLALYIAPDGAIEDIHWNDCSVSLLDLNDWIGRPWIDTVTIESRQKIEALFTEAKTSGLTKWREINQTLSSGRQLPMRYCLVPLGADGRYLAIGRDLAAVSALQQQLIQAQQSLDRGLAKARQADTRYQVLFQSSGEAILVLEAWSFRVLEANTTALQMLEGNGRKVRGKQLPDFFALDDQDIARSLFSGVRATGRPADGVLRLGLTQEQQSVSALLFRQTRESQLLVRIASPTAAASNGGGNWARLQQVYGAVEHHPDAFVITDTSGRILKPNAAFLELAQMAVDLQVEGELIDRWLGRPGIDVPLVLSSLQDDTTLRNLSTIMRGELGLIEDVVVSAVRVTAQGVDCIGFLIREASSAETMASSDTSVLPRSVEQMSELVGRVPLKELVRETTDIIEKLCIDAALQLTGDNRASAAEMLGLSRQSLYSKMRRFGIGDLGPEGKGDVDDT